MNHTPGPWEIQESNLLKISHEITHDTNDGFTYPIADIHAFKNSLLNAKLIAAAPDLLQACKAAKISLIGDDEHYKFKQIIEVIDKAIKKAT